MRSVLVALAIVLAALAVAAVAVALFIGTGGGQSLSRSEVSDAARAFAAAYGKEDSRALSSLFAPNVERISPSDVQRGRRTVLAEYRRQFRDNATREYRLDGLEVSAGSAGRASARFTVRRSNRPPITGRVVLGVEKVRDKARIRLIATEPRA